jgi:hypothetical protein
VRAAGHRVAGPAELALGQTEKRQLHAAGSVAGVRVAAPGPGVERGERGNLGSPVARHVKQLLFLRSVAAVAPRQTVFYNV